MNTPEERIQCVVDDLCAIIVKTGGQSPLTYTNTFLGGARAISKSGAFSLLINSNPRFAGQIASTQTGGFRFVSSPTRSLPTVFAQTQIGVFKIGFGVTGQSVLSQCGILSLLENNSPRLIGVQVTTNLSGSFVHIVRIPTVGLLATTHFGVMATTSNLSLSGVYETITIAHLGAAVLPKMLGVAAATQRGVISQVLSRGQSATANFGILTPRIDYHYLGVATVARVGTNLVPLLLHPAGLQATSGTGQFGISISS